MSRSLLLGLAAVLAAGVAFAQSAPPTDSEAPDAAQAETAPEKTATPAIRDLRRPMPIRGDAAAGQAKSELCAACHGATGTANAPIFPNLAGQNSDYLYWELVDYKNSVRVESPMNLLAATLEEQDMRDLAAFYAAQAPQAIVADESTPPPDPAALQRGQALYLSGDPASGIPPCQGCHGTEARGHGPSQANGHRDAYYAIYPALRGQQGAYLQAKLTEFRDGKLHHSTNDQVMTGVGARLDDDSILAISTWLSSLPP